MCNMSPPTVKNLRNRQRDGFKTFSQWYDHNDNLYIGRNAGKYAQRSVKDSKWVNPFLCVDFEVAKKEWAGAELVRSYEKYVRGNNELMNSLHELGGKNLGCWCKPGVCHGDVLVKLYNEMHGEQPSEKRRKTQRCEN